MKTALTSDFMKNFEEEVEKAYRGMESKISKENLEQCKVDKKFTSPHIASFMGMTIVCNPLLPPHVIVVESNGETRWFKLAP